MKQRPDRPCPSVYRQWQPTAATGTLLIRHLTIWAVLSPAEPTSRRLHLRLSRHDSTNDPRSAPLIGCFAHSRAARCVLIRRIPAKAIRPARAIGYNNYSRRSDGTDSGRSLNENSCQSGRSANTVLQYIQQTVDALPPGTNVDGTRYSGAGSGTTYCEDEPKDENSAVSFAFWGDLNLPTGIETNAVISQIGDIWKRWGWQVLERQGFEKPNRFGYAPDGYVLQVKAAYPPTYPPTIIGSSPCFPGSLRKDGVPFPTVINRLRPRGDCTSFEWAFHVRTGDANRGRVPHMASVCSLFRLGAYLPGTAKRGWSIMIRLTADVFWTVILLPST